MLHPAGQGHPDDEMIGSRKQRKPRQGFWCQKPSGAGGLEGTAPASDSDSGGVGVQVPRAKVLELHMRSNRKRKAAKGSKRLPEEGPALNQVMERILRRFYRKNSNCVELRKSRAYL